MALKSRREIARPELPIAMIRAGLEVRETAALVGITPSALTAITRGRTRIPKPETRQALSRVLDTSVAELFPDIDGDDVQAQFDALEAQLIEAMR